MYEPIKQAINQIEKIADLEWDIFQSILSISELNKGDFILKEEQTCKAAYFVVKGSVRNYILIDGKEVNTSFYFENDFFSEFESLSTSKPSKKNIQVLEKSVIIHIPKSKLIGLYNESPYFQSLGRKMLEKVVIAEQQYSSLFTLFSPQERYAFILKNHPYLIQKIPLHFLASYLGIARETLSRIRKRML